VLGFFDSMPCAHAWRCDMALSYRAARKERTDSCKLTCPLIAAPLPTFHVPQRPTDVHKRLVELVKQNDRRAGPFIRVGPKYDSD
jgi:hypothetical protein